MKGYSDLVLALLIVIVGLVSCAPATTSRNFSPIKQSPTIVFPTFPTIIPPSSVARVGMFSISMMRECLLVEIIPTDAANAGEVYQVNLFEKGNLRATTTVSWSQIELNATMPKKVSFPLSAAEFRVYFFNYPKEGLFTATVDKVAASSGQPNKTADSVAAPVQQPIKVQPTISTLLPTYSGSGTTPTPIFSTAGVNNLTVYYSFRETVKLKELSIYQSNGKRNSSNLGAYARTANVETQYGPKGIAPGSYYIKLISEPANIGWTIRVTGSNDPAY